MLDNEFYISRESKAVLISIVSPDFEDHKSIFETERSLVELRELLRTLEISAGKDYVQNRKEICASTIVGKGKLAEIAEEAKNDGANLLVFDFELTAGQIKNIKKITGLSVVDRCHIILEIFAQHARTREAKIQIEMARLQYILPRLTGFWGHLSRQRGGVGVMSGEGEKQIELDRRIIKDKIEYFKKELRDIAKSRKEQRKKRQNMAITAALVGYTNSGKSSVMNRLCQVHVTEENKLFATLDATYRTLNPDTKPPMILIDTVGFISNLPNTLIRGFKTTLESAMEADLLLIVCDISDPNYKKHLEVTQSVLEELGVWDKEKLFIFNKRDKLQDELTAKITTRIFPNSFLVSTLNPGDMNGLRQYIIKYFLDKQKHHDLFIPYEQGNAHSIVLGKTNVLTTVNHEKGIFYRVRVPDFIFNALDLTDYILGPGDPRLAELEKPTSKV